MASSQPSFFSTMRTKYGNDGVLKLKQYSSLNTKLCQMTNRKDFLIQCRKVGVFPSHIINSLKCVYPLFEDKSPLMSKVQKIIEKFKRSLLSIEIKHTFYKIKQIKNNLNLVKLDIDNYINIDEMNKFITTQNQRITKITIKHNLKMTKKLNHLLNKAGQHDDRLPTFTEKAVHNATSKIIPEEMLTLLSLGPKFALPTNNMNEIPFFHLIADVETIINTEPDKTKQDINRCAVVNNIKNFITGIKQHTQNTPLNCFCRKATTATKRFLSENPNIRILQSDKGKKMVIMDIDDYNRKMLELLNNDTYKTLDKDPTSTIQRKTNNIISRLNDLKLIDKKQATYLQSKTAICPRIYGQPKAHKDALPLRPVVPNITAPTYQLAKYMSKILQQSLKSIYNIKDVFVFASHINQTTLPPDYVLVSFDVVSLFTNIPKHLVIHDIIMLWENIRQYTNINLDFFLEIIEFCIDNSYFQFNGQVYIQTFGTAMGSPLSPILADIVMETLLLTVINQLNFVVPLINKYVDDLIIALPKDKIESTLDIFNSYNPHLQFTMEIEKDNKLPFLDVLITHNINHTLQTEWYSKPIASGRLLNYHSFHSTAMKINVAYNFTTRVIKLTNNRSKQYIKNLISQNLQQNNYPKRLINRIFNEIIHKVSNQNHITGNAVIITPENINHSCLTMSNAQTTSINQQTQQSITAPPKNNACLATSNPTQVTSINTSQMAAASTTTTNIMPQLSPVTNNTALPINDSNLPAPIPTTYFSIPYVAHLSENIKRTLKREYKNVKISYRTCKTTNCLFPSVKDPVNKMHQHNVIYSVKCTLCPKVYIGMTRSQLCVRLSGHKSDINKYNNITNTTQIDQPYELERIKQKTALMQHIVENGHMFDLTQTRILDKTHRSSALPVLEICQIAMNDNNVNHRKDVDGLSAIYGGILSAIKSNNTPN